MVNMEYEINTQATTMFTKLYPTLGGKKEELRKAFEALDCLLDGNSMEWGSYLEHSPYKQEIGKAYNEVVELWGDSRMGLAVLYMTIKALLKDCEDVK